MKLLADAVIANGVNRIVYHGMPYNGPSTNYTFYATVHVGPDSPFADKLPQFNSYLTSVCDMMTQGEPAHQIGVYFPVEDNMILGQLPREEKGPGAMHHFEMRTVTIPKETEGYHPLWVTNRFLKDANFDATSQILQIGKTSISGLYVDCQWIDLEALRSMVRLAQSGLPIVVKNWDIKQPGFIKNDQYPALLETLKNIPNVHSSITAFTMPPLLSTSNETSILLGQEAGR